MRATQAVAESGLELGSSESRDAGVAPSSTDIVHALTVCMPAFGLGTVNKGKKNSRGPSSQRTETVCCIRCVPWPAQERRRGVERVVEALGRGKLGSPLLQDQCGHGVSTGGVWTWVRGLRMEPQV